MKGPVRIVLRRPDGRHIAFRYTNCTAVLHVVPVNDGTVYVIGEPEGASYEWAFATPEGVASHSDVGYGFAEIALRDGLIAALGLPDAAM
jgi:hypothetical protein